MEECSVLVADEFNVGLSKRKAIYKNYSEAFPDVPDCGYRGLKK